MQLWKRDLSLIASEIASASKPNFTDRIPQWQDFTNIGKTSQHLKSLWKTGFRIFLEIWDLKLSHSLVATDSGSVDFNTLLFNGSTHSTHSRSNYNVTEEKV